MRNDECIIKFLNKDGKALQSFQRDKDGWFEISSKGIVRRCTAEQTLSHLLPPLAGVSRAIVKVERISPNRIGRRYFYQSFQASFGFAEKL